MKSLKLEHTLAVYIADDQISTWRIFDDQDLSVNDEVQIIDKTNPENPATWKELGLARIDRVLEKRLADVTETDIDSHETLSSKEDILTISKKYFGPNVTFTTPIKIVTSHFIKNKKDSNENTTTAPIKKVKIFSDGGSRGNPGPSASGYVILDAITDKVLVDKGIYLGITTNNQAEYLALKFALEEAAKMGARDLDVYLDSLLVVNQMKGIFKVKNRDLWPIHDSIKELVGRFSKVTFTHVPRELNRLADAAVNRAMDEQLL